MKKFILLSSIALLTACSPMGPLATEAENFLNLLEADRQAAFQSTSNEFKTQTTVQRFDELVDYLALDQVEGSDWQVEENNEAYGVVQGELSRTDKEASLPVLFEFVFEDNTWKILGVTSDLPTFKATDLEDEKLFKEINDTMMAFVGALDTEDFTEFYANEVAELWKLELSQKKIEEVFQELIDNEVNVNFIENLDPIVVEKGFTNSDTYLNIRGQYIVKAEVLAFNLQYILEDREWKVTKIEVSTQ